MKTYLILGIIPLFFPAAVFSEGGDCADSTWVTYKDEKCLKLENTYANYEEAEAICKSHGAEVLTIKSSEEQDFVSEFVFENSSVAIDVWLAASRRGNTNEFQWNSDGTPVTYAKWKVGAPSNSTEKLCVQITSHLSKHSSKELVNGKWEDASCLKPNYVVCESLPYMPLDKLLKIVFQNRNNIQEHDSRLEATEESDLQIELELTANAAADLLLKNKLTENEAADLVQENNLAANAAADLLLKNKLTENEAADLVQENNLAANAAADLLLKNKLTENEASDLVQKNKLAANEVADEIQKNKLAENEAADLVQKNNLAANAAADLVQKNNLAANAAADLVQKNNLAANAAADLVQKNNLAANAAADLVQKNNLAANTAADVVQKNNLAANLNADLVQKNLLSANTAADVQTKNEIAFLKANPVPLGFIYVQLSGQPKPRDIWPNVNFLDVTSNYAGLFFRAEGGNAASFGQTQGASNPRLNRVSYSDSGDAGSATLDVGATRWLRTGYHHGGDHDDSGESISFSVDNVENRPVNTAIRIWKRT